MNDDDMTVSECETVAELVTRLGIDPQTTLSALRSRLGDEDAQMRGKRPGAAWLGPDESFEDGVRFYLADATDTD